MDEVNIQFEDFLTSVNVDYKDFVNTVSEMVLQANYSNIKIGTSKTNIFSVSYSQPKTRLGIVNFYLRKKGLKIAVHAKNCAKYSDVLLGLPERMLSQIDKVQPCKNLIDPGACMGKCAGYDFHIGETHYQKCRFGCFQFDVDAESIPFLLELLENELKERMAVTVYSTLTYDSP